MAAINNATSINLVKDEIDVTLTQTEASLEAFVDDPNQSSHLEKAIFHFHQIKGVCILLELPAAEMLADEMEALSVLIGEKADAETGLAALSNATMVLGRYFEYVQVKRSSTPVLLTATINEVRKELKKQIIPESYYFEAKLTAPRSNPPSGETLDDKQVAMLAVKLRKYYQASMLSITQDKDIQRNLVIMAKVMTKLDQLTGHTPLGKLWWLARGVLIALLKGGLSLNTERKSMLGLFDRQLKAVVQQGNAALQRDPPLLAVKEAVYMVSLSANCHYLISEIKLAYNLPVEGLSEKEIINERKLMTGPGGSVIKTVASALKEELASLKATLDAAARSSGSTYLEVSEGLARIAQTLLMLSLNNESQSMMEQASLVSAWDGQEVDPSSDHFQALVDELLAVENSVAILEQKFTPSNAINKGDEKSNVSLYQLDDAKMTVLSESRSGLSLAKRAVTSYMESSWDQMHLNNVPSTLNTVAGSLMFLNLDRSNGILQAAVNYIETALMAAGVDAPDERSMCLLADAVTGIDYYLESMEVNKPIGEGVLDIAESSMDELGFPVVRRNQL